MKEKLDLDVSPEVQELLDESKKLIELAKDYFVSNGQVFEIGKWLTITKYCRKYNIKDDAVVTNWIKRGIIPPEDVHTFVELNNLRMIRDRKYK